MILFLWLLLIFSFLAIVSVFLAKIPEVAERKPARIAVSAGFDSIPVYLLSKIKLLITKIWHFILEAKDLTPPITTSLNQQVQKIRNVFRVRIRRSEKDPVSMPEVANTVPLPTEDKGRTMEQIYLNEIKKNPGNLQAYEALGRLYLQEKNFVEAEEIFRHLLKLNPSKDIYHSNLALILYSLQRYQEAAGEYEKALSINSKIPARWINLGLSFLAQDDLSRAIKAVANALHLDPRNINYLSLLADIYVKAKNWIRAEEVLQQILQLDPTNRGAREKLMRLKI